MVRFPASVLDIDSASHASSLWGMTSMSGLNSSTSGTFETRFESNTDGPLTITTGESISGVPSLETPRVHDMDLEGRHLHEQAGGHYEERPVYR